MEIPLQFLWRREVFTGIIQEVGKVIYLRRRGRGASLKVESFDVLRELETGDSVAVDGVCLTVASKGRTWFEADLSEETVRTTAFKNARAGMLVNLEPPLKAGDMIGGHYVTGHVDGTGRVVSLERQGGDHRLKVRVPSNLLQFIVPKGSVAVNGVSLTVASLRGSIIEVALIPETLKRTNLKLLRPGCIVNIETDILVKSVRNQQYNYKGGV